MIGIYKNNAVHQLQRMVQHSNYNKLQYEHNIFSEEQKASRESYKKKFT